MVFGQKVKFSQPFDGTGFVGRRCHNGRGVLDHVFQTELYIDGKLEEKPVLPTAFHDRRHELCWKYDLPNGKHDVRLKILNPQAGAEIRPAEAIIYSDKPVNALEANY
jgi:hypothetical protein